MSNGTPDYKFGEYDAQMKELFCKFDKNDEDHKEIMTKIDSLNMWRWKVIGGSIAGVGILNIIWDYLKSRI